MQREKFIREQVAKEITNIFKGKNLLTPDQAYAIKHPPKTKLPKLNLQTPHMIKEVDEAILPKHLAKEKAKQKDARKEMKTSDNKIAN